jgi:DNA repair photolyase
MTRNEQPSLFEDDEPAGPAVVDGVVIREVRCKNLLNRGGIGDYSFNCYTGCAHGCVYCYARFMQRFHPHDESWGEFVDVKINAPDALARQLRRLSPGSVFTCSACDGWQPVEARYRLTRQCCGMLLDAGFNLNILTKSDLVLRDLDILAGRDVRLAVTITTADEVLARVWEPRASSVADRLRVLSEAKAAGLKTGVMLGPLLPGISDTDQALAELFALAAQADVDRSWTDALNPRVWPSVQTLLRDRWPDLVEPTRRLLFDRAHRSQYQAALNRRIGQAASDAGLADRLA